MSVQPGLRSGTDLRVGQKMATFQSFFQSAQAKDLSAPLYNSALFFLPSCCCPFLLHVIANVIVYVLSFFNSFCCQIYQNFFIPFVAKKGVPGCSYEKFHHD